MAYQFDSRIRFSEAGLDRKLTLVSLVDYFQDCSIFHSEACGLGMDFLNKEDLSWMILFWQIDLVRRPMLGERVTIATWPYDFHGLYGYRNFALLDEDGAFLAKANSVWALMNKKTGRPRKVEERFVNGYGHEPRLEMEYVSRKITPNGAGEKKEAITIGRQHLDTNRHVNNGQYLYLAEEYLPEDFETGRLTVEYRRQARLHDVVVPWVYREEKAVTVSLTDAAGNPFAIIREEDVC